MNQDLMKRFLDRYETADTQRAKALAIYNAMVTVLLPAKKVRDFLGKDGEAFLSFIRTLQNEDADVGTALAREEDAPSDEYLAALAEKLSKLEK